MFDRIEEVRVAGSANVCMSVQRKVRFRRLGFVAGRESQREMALDIRMGCLYV